MTRLTLTQVTADTPSSTLRRISVVPDSFKGSVSARDAADAMARGLRSGFSDTPWNVQIDTLPVADGGEGTLEAFLAAWQVTAQMASVTDALGRPATARYALSPDGTTAIIEAAQANGLTLVDDAPLRPLEASSRGVGEIAAQALDAGVEEIILCIGGSASTDGGVGLLSALGARFLDEAGSELVDGGGALRALDSIDLDALHPRARDVAWRIACDVTNPLVGDRGAAAVFGPQKGADDADVQALDAGLAQLAAVLHTQTGTDVSDVPGTGAAGGIPAVMITLLDAQLVAGADVVFDALDVAQLLGEADLVVTGEGRFDSQSFDGKVVDAVRRHTPDDVPVIVIAGAVDVDAQRLADAHITAAVSIASGPCSLDALADGATDAITRTAHDIARLIAAGSRFAHLTEDATP